MSPINKRYLCIYLPLWAINLAQFRYKNQYRYKITAPLMLISKNANQLLIKRCCPQTQHQGVRPGMPLPLAKAISPTALTFPFDPYRDLQALRKLALRALRFSPLVSIDSDLLAAERAKTLETIAPLYNGILIDISGTEKLHRDERMLAEKILTRFMKLSIQARIAIAPTIGTAWALSRFSPNSIHILSQSESIREILSDLPIEALRLQQETILALQALGIRSINALLKLPSRQLGARFGVLLLKRLDQAHGAIEENFEAIQAPELVRAQRRFEVPLTNQETIKIATLYLFQSVFKELALQKKKAGSFNIVLAGQDNERLHFQRSKQVFLNTTTRNFQHIASVLDPLINNLVIPGGVHALSVIAYDVERAHEEQINYLSPADLHFLVQSSHEFLNSLVTRLGKEKVTTVSFQNSYLPERSFSYQPLPQHKQKTQLVANKEECSSGVSLGRPPYLLRKPERITALSILPDKPPVRLNWKGHELGILQASGPERIAPEWWNLHLSIPDQEREYFKVQDHFGRWLWVYRDRSSMQWFLQGLWG